MTPPTPSTPTTPRRGKHRVALLLFLALAAFELLKTVRFHTPRQIDLQQLRLRDLQGRELPADALRNKAVLLNYWAPWCGPCKLEVPWLAQLQRDHPNDLVVLGIVDDPQDFAEALAFMQSKGATYPLVQLSRPLSEAVGEMHTVPTSFYLSRSGRVLHANNGLVPRPVLEHWANDAIRSK